MSRGYIVIAQNTQEVDYLKQAYALALNLKLTQAGVSRLTVCVDDKTKKCLNSRHREIFDHIVDIPWGDAAEKSSWKIENKWKYYYMSPYDETVILDTDMLFPTDVSYWWKMLSQNDVWATTNVRTYRGDIVDNYHYRPYIKANDMPNVYTAFMYFKKSQLASELFAMTEIIFQHWKRFFHKYMPEGKPDWLSGDIAFSLAMKLLNIQHLCTKDHVKSFPTFVHMKSFVQNVDGAALEEAWKNSLPTYYASCDNFKIGNFQQTYPFHYSEKDWLTDDMIKQMEKKYG